MCDLHRLLSLVIRNSLTQYNHETKNTRHNQGGENPKSFWVRFHAVLKKVTMAAAGQVLIFYVRSAVWSGLPLSLDLCFKLRISIASYPLSRSFWIFLVHSGASGLRPHREREHRCRTPEKDKYVVAMYHEMSHNGRDVPNND